ncbi:MAG: BACON domain-containing protein [Bacteroidales bacterium]|nr:BACON domain-containing protein [Bacteroidales bacterium]
MKKIFMSLMLVALGFFALISCSKEKQEPIVGDAAFIINLGVDTKAQMTDEYGIQWETGDPVQIITPNDESTNEKELAAPVVSGLSDENHVASIAYGLEAGKDYAFRFNFNGTDEFLFSNSVVQPTAGVLPKAYLHLHSATTMSPVSSEEVAAGAANRTMAIAGSIIRFLPFTASYSSESVQSILFKCDSWAFGTVRYNYFNGAFDPWGEDLFYAGNRQKSGTVSLTTPFSLATANSKEASKGLYLPIAAHAGTINGYTVVVTTDVAIYTFTTTKSLTVNENTVLNMGLNLDKATRSVLADLVWPSDASFELTALNGVDAARYTIVTAANKLSTTVTLADENHVAGGFGYSSANIESFEIVSKPDNAVAYIQANNINFDFYENKGDFDIEYLVVANNYARRNYVVHVIRPSSTTKSFDVPTTSFNVGYDATSVEIPVSSKNIEWTATITGDDTGSATRTVNASSVTVNFPENTESVEKEINIRISTEDTGVTPSYFDVTITQAAAGVISWPADASFNHGGVTSGVTITGDNESEFTVNVPATGYYPFHMYFSLTNVTLSINSANLPSGVGVDASLTNGTGWTSGAGCPFWVTENSSMTPVQYDVPLTMTANNGAVKTYTMHIIRAANVLFTVASTNINVAASATSATIALTANVAWTASVTSGAATIDVSSGSSNANIEVSFAENTDTENAKTYQVTLVSSGRPDIVVTITQAKAGGGSTPVYTYSIARNNGNGSGATWGIGINATTANDFSITNASLGGTPVDLTDPAVAEAVVAQAFSVEDPGDEMGAGYAAYSFDADAIKIVPTNYFSSTSLGAGVKSWGTNGYKAKIVWKDSDGTELGHWFVFIPF